MNDTNQTTTNTKKTPDNTLKKTSRCEVGSKNNGLALGLSLLSFWLFKSATRIAPQLALVFLSV